MAEEALPEEDLKDTSEVSQVQTQNTSEVEGSTKVSTPEVKTKNPILLPILLSLVMFLLGGAVVFAYFVFLKPEKVVPQLAVSPSPSPVPISSPTPFPSPTPDVTIDWKTYTDVEERFSFRYPPTWEMNKVQDRIANEIVSFEFWGPTQKAGTELYDGIGVIFAARKNPKGLSPKEYALKENALERDTGRTEFEESISVGGRVGYKLVVSGLGKSILIYLPLGDGILEIIIFGDVDNPQYSNQYNLMLQTFKFLD
jgi:hypothetical protein